VLQVREGRAAGEAPRGLEPDVLLWVQGLHEGQAPGSQEGEGDMSLATIGWCVHREYYFLNRPSQLLLGFDT
jgi:hypothetical protein